MQNLSPQSKFVCLVGAVLLAVAGGIWTNSALSTKAASADGVELVSHPVSPMHMMIERRTLPAFPDYDAF